MKNILIILGFFAFTNIVSFAQERVIATEKPLLIASNTLPSATLKTEKIKVVIPSNVEFPSILSNHVEESREYVEKFSNNRRDYLIRIYQKGKKLLPKVAAIMKKYNVPTELKVLIALESGYKANAMSGAGAFGYWQFMDAAAKEYGLKIIEAKDTAEAARLKRTDDRTNFVKSTIAAAKYLRDRSRNLNNDWLLIVASYNCGIGNVWQAIKSSGKKDATFWNVQKFLPAETRAYVMNFITVNVIFNNYDKFLKKNLQFTEKEIEKIVTINGPEEVPSL